MDPDHETCKAIVERSGAVMKGFVSDPDFIDLLRVMQLALGRGGIERKDIPELAEKIVLEYPTRNPQMNRELVRLVAYLQGNSAGGTADGTIGGRHSFGRQIAGGAVCAVSGRLDDAAKTGAF